MPVKTARQKAFVSRCMDAKNRITVHVRGCLGYGTFPGGVKPSAFATEVPEATAVKQVEREAVHLHLYRWQLDCGSIRAAHDQASFLALVPSSRQ